MARPVAIVQMHLKCILFGRDGIAPVSRKLRWPGTNHFGLHTVWRTTNLYAMPTYPIAARTRPRGSHVSTNHLSDKTAGSELHLSQRIVACGSHSRQSQRRLPPTPCTPASWPAADRADQGSSRRRRAESLSDGGTVYVIPDRRRARQSVPSNFGERGPGHLN